MDKPFIPDFYKEKDIFVTGATGFMGKVLLEKLLRSCNGLRRIFVLMRAKGGVSSQARLDELLDTENQLAQQSPLTPPFRFKPKLEYSPSFYIRFKLMFELLRRQLIVVPFFVPPPQIFNALRASDPCFAQGKVIAVEGDLTLSELGLSAEHKRALCENVDIVFHSAAIVKFDEPLKSSIDMNVLGTRRLLQLCQGMAFVHVSTAYCNCDKEDVAEIIYPPPFNPQSVIDALRQAHALQLHNRSWMDDALVEAITPKLLGSRPNMYTFTKALAESLVAEERGNLPVAIVRPSIVTAAWQEPIPGWIDNINGPTGLLVASGKGLLRSMLADTEKAADFVPVDVVINTMIIVAWYTATQSLQTAYRLHKVPGKLRGSFEIGFRTRRSPVIDALWARQSRTRSFCGTRCPTPSAIRAEASRRVASSTPSPCLKLRNHFFLFRMVKLFTKLYKVMVSLEYFTTHEWRFNCTNLLALLQEISPADREIFCIDLRLLDWGRYFKDYVVGTRKFVLKEDPATVPEGRNTLRRLYIYQQLLYAGLLAFVWRLVMCRSKSACRLWHAVLSLFLPLLSLISSVVGLPCSEDIPKP
ncbi:unnamed protein product [Ixodes hexagonus]